MNDLLFKSGELDLVTLLNTPVGVPLLTEDGLRIFTGHKPNQVLLTEGRGRRRIPYLARTAEDTGEVRADSSLITLALTPSPTEVEEGQFTANGYPIKIYRATSSFTYAANYEPGVGADWKTKWVQQPDSGPYFVRILRWALATAYEEYQLVSHNGRRYKCRAGKGHTSSAATEPGVGADWQTVWARKEDGVPWRANKFYRKYAFARNGTPERVYRATVSHLSAALTEPGVGANWATVWELSDPYDLTRLTPRRVDGDHWIPVPNDCDDGMRLIMYLCANAVSIEKDILEREGRTITSVQPIDVATVGGEPTLAFIVTGPADLFGDLWQNVVKRSSM